MFLNDIKAIYRNDPPHGESSRCYMRGFMQY